MIGKILLFLMFSFLALAIFTNWETCSLYDEVLTDGNFTIRLCRTGSMCDQSFEGYVAYAPQVISEIHIGDIILFRKLSADTGIAHRVVRIEGQFITTKGDCNSVEDESVPFDNIAYILRE